MPPAARADGGVRSKGALASRIGGELNAQVTDCDGALADQLARLFRHLHHGMSSSMYDDTVSRAATLAWRDIAAGRRVDLSALLAELNTRECGREVASAHAAAGGNHGFPVTRMIAALENRRGVRLIPSDFLWLRAADRTLWYVVNNHGRGTVFLEGVGPLAHYRAEKADGQRHTEPRTGEAIRTVVLDLAASGDVRFEGKPA
jgi:hypothetical protein